MEYLINIYYIKSVKSDEDVKLKFVQLNDFCINLEEEEDYIRKCPKDFLEKMFKKEKIINSPYSDEKTLKDFSKKLKVLRESFGDKKILKAL